MHLQTVTLIALLFSPTKELLTQRVVFEGEPLKRVESSFEGTSSIDLEREDAFKARVRIVERSGRYYWQSRGMKEMTRSESGAYITYAAIDGSGYVRTHIPVMLDLREHLPEERRDREIGYTEHLLIQFASITYFGNRRPPSK
jgi:hypothetical protein